MRLARLMRSLERGVVSDYLPELGIGGCDLANLCSSVSLNSLNSNFRVSH